MGHFNCIGYAFSGWLGKLIGGKKADDTKEKTDSSNVNLPKWFELFRDFVFSVAMFMSKAMAAAGVDALSVITPYFLKPTDDNLYAHYCEIAASVNIPIILYNIPKATGCPITPALADRLADVPNIAGIKDSSGDLDNLNAFAEIARRKDFQLLVGSDSKISYAYGIGAAAAIAGTSNVITDTLVGLDKALRSGDSAKAEQLQKDIDVLRGVLKLGTVPSVMKEYAFTVQLLENYKDTENIQKADINYITAWILGISFGDVREDTKDCVIIAELVGKIMTRFESLSGSHYQNTEEIFVQLYSHFRPAYYRLIFHLPILNPLRERIQAEYQELYALVAETMKPFSVLWGEEIPADEIAYLTMHQQGLLHLPAGARPRPGEHAAVAVPGDRPGRRPDSGAGPAVWAERCPVFDAGIRSLRVCGVRAGHPHDIPPAGQRHPQPDGSPGADPGSVISGNLTWSALQGVW